MTDLSQFRKNITEFLTLDNIIILQSANKNDVINSLIELVSKSTDVTSPKELVDGIYSREKLMSTGIGLGIGIPHARIPSVKNIVMAAALVKDGVSDYDSLDSSLVKFVLMIVAREDQHAEHLKLLSGVSGKFKEENFRNEIFLANSTETIYNLLTK